MVVGSTRKGFRKLKDVIKYRRTLLVAESPSGRLFRSLERAEREQDSGKVTPDGEKV